MTETHDDAATRRPAIEFDRPPMPSHSEGVQSVLRSYLKARRRAGFLYVTADDIRRDLEWDPMPQKIGANLRALQQSGAVEKWSDGTPATYQITLEADDE